MARPWWALVLQWTLWLVVMALVMGWVARSRTPRRSDPQGGLLEHPISTLVLGLVCFAFFGGITVISNTIGKNRTTTVWTTLTFVAFALASVPMILEYCFARHRVSDEGMEHRGMFGRRRMFGWSEVKRVRYADLMKWFVIELESGPRLRVSAMLKGLPRFARILLSHVPRSAIDDATFEVLNETGQGKLPSVWG